MMSFTYRDRPTCTQVLWKYQQWQQTHWQENKLNQIKQVDNQFFYEYIKSKVNHIFC